MKNKKLEQFMSKGSIYIIVLLLYLLIGGLDYAKSHRWSFLSVNNLVNVLQEASIRIVIALGVLGVLITKGVDLSAGKLVGLGTVISASMLQKPSYEAKFFTDFPILPVFIPLLIVLMAGGFAGLINGILVAVFSIPPFITTLGMMVIVYGTSLIYTKSQPIGGLRNDFTAVSSGRIFGIVPSVIIIMLIVVLVYWYLLNKTRFGKNIYAVGGNPLAAEVSGINLKAVLISTYTIAGALYCFAGFLLAARTGGGSSNYGNMYELDAIAACTIGGVSTSGGIGKVSSAISGVLIFSALSNGLVILGVDAYWQQIIKGIIIIVAVGIDIRKYLVKR